MLATDGSPIHLLGKVGFNLALGLLLPVAVIMLETCMLLPGVRVQEHW